MALSPLPTVFKIPKKTLQEMAKSIDKPVERFKLSKKDRESLATIVERFQKWLENNKH